MAVSTNRVPLSGLARRLVADGLLEESVVAQAFQDALGKKIPFVRFLVEHGVADGRAIAHAASNEFGVPMLDIDAIDIDPDTIKLVNRDLIRELIAEQALSQLLSSREGELQLGRILPAEVMFAARVRRDQETIEIVLIGTSTETGVRACSGAKSQSLR